MDPIEAKLSRFGHNKMSNFTVAEVTEKVLNDTKQIIMDTLSDAATDGKPSDINR